jgi:hypothetical protein
VTAAVQQYRATCRATDCDWTLEGTRDEVDASAAQHRADHVAAKRWSARCTWGCDWSTTGSEKWVRGAWERHKAEHRAATDERDARRAARYRWRGTPNPTQRRLLEQVRAGALGAYRCRVRYGFTGVPFYVWYTTNVSARDGLWWPALERAGLVVARPMWSGGAVPRGVWQLTVAGRRVLEGGAS